MKARMPVGFYISALASISIFSLPCFAQNASYSTTRTTTAPATSNALASQQVRNSDTSTTAADTESSSWKQSAADATDNAQLAGKRAYNYTSRGIKDVTLEGRVQAVLRENKSTRNSDVHVTADNGIVTITGNVPSERKARKVQAIVASVYGVKAVNNNLNYPRTQGAATPPDADSMGVAHPAYSDTAPAEDAPAR
jgi:osmotically-inducible protein OsmY